MSEQKVIVCLANSWKHQDRCVAGIEVFDDQPGAWIRPVSSRDGHGVSFSERQLPGGVEPAPLDIILVPLIAARPSSFQTENWLLDPSSSWSKIGDVPWGNLGQLEDTPADLWGTGDSSGKGMNDRVAETAANCLGSSLVLIPVNRPVLHVLDGGFNEVKREVRAIFKHRGATYNLKVTDPTYVASYLSRADGQYRLGDCYMTVSLAEPFLGFCYKVVAAILEPGGAPEDVR